MKLKLDDKGNAVLIEGKPVYVYEDGKEVPFDADAATRRISNLTDEKDRHYNNVESLKVELAKFSDITDPEEAVKALATVANLKDKDLVDAGEVEKLKQQMSDTFESERTQLTTTYEAEKTRLTDDLSTKNGTIRKLMIDTRFASSPWFSGEKPKTILPPDIAAEHFGKHFKVEGDSVVGYIGENKILSRERVGEPAGFEEALTVIVDSYPQKDRILRGSAGGSGSGGNTDFGGEDLSKLPPTERLNRARGLS